MSKFPRWTVFILALALLVPAAAAQTPLSEMSEQELLDWMAAANEQIAAAGYDIAIEEIEFFTIGGGRSSVKTHQQPFRWGRATRGASRPETTSPLSSMTPTTPAPPASASSSRRKSPPG